MPPWYAAAGRGTPSSDGQLANDEFDVTANGPQYFAFVAP